MPESRDPDPAGVPLALSPSERKVLEVLRATGEGALEEEEVVRRADLPPDQVRGSLQRLRAKGLALVQEEHESVSRLTPRGSALLARGLPERRLLALLQSRASVAPDVLGDEGFSAEEGSAAIGFLRRRGLLAPGVPLRLRQDPLPPEGPFPEETALRRLSEGTGEVEPGAVDALVRRGLARRESRSRKRWSASEEGRRLVLGPAGVEPIGALTSELLATGGWKERPFRPYDVRAPTPYLTGARENPYLAWLEEFEEILVGLGFSEAEGPLLETEFWNNDVLFMPQDHPARSIHDALSLEGVVGRLPSADLLARVAAVHEGRPLPGEETSIGPGWGVAYDAEIARRAVLRSQTTAVSARFLAGRPTPPFRVYSIDRNLRREEVDPRHHVEFRQSEGIVGEDGMTLRHLVGLFRELAEAIGIRELKIRPSYFPFTEPSIEGYVRHPRLGWMEVLPGGVFRPEVLRPLRIDVPVLAWGIGITRLAMVALGYNDIRELFADDLAVLSGGTP